MCRVKGHLGSFGVTDLLIHKSNIAITAKVGDSKSYLSFVSVLVPAASIIFVLTLLCANQAQIQGGGPVGLALPLLHQNLKKIRWDKGKGKNFF